MNGLGLVLGAETGTRLGPPGAGLALALQWCGAGVGPRLLGGAGMGAGGWAGGRWAGRAGQGAGRGGGAGEGWGRGWRWGRTEKI